MSEGPSAVDTTKIPLAEMIEMLRQELQRSQELGKDQSVAFEIDKVELELKVAVSRKDKGGVGLAFWVIKADASTEGTRDTIHNFKLTLTPVSSPSGARLKVAEHTAVPAPRD